MRLSSPWGSAPRGPLRAVLAAVLTFDLIDLVRRLHERAAGPESAPDAPRLMLALGGAWLAPSLLAAVGAGAALRFARRPRALGAGALALVAHGALVESLAAVRGARWHNYYTVAAALSGWLAVLAFHRLGEGRECEGAVAAVADEVRDLVRGASLVEREHVARPGLPRGLGVHREGREGVRVADRERHREVREQHARDDAHADPVGEGVARALRGFGALGCHDVECRERARSA